MGTQRGVKNGAFWRHVLCSKSRRTAFCRGHCAKNIAMSKTLGDDMPISMEQPRSKRTKNRNHAPMPASFHDIDTAVLAELPEDIRLELSRLIRRSPVCLAVKQLRARNRRKSRPRKAMTSKIGGRKQKSLYDMFQRRTS